MAAEVVRATHNTLQATSAEKALLKQSSLHKDLQ